MSTPHPDADADAVGDQQDATALYLRGGRKPFSFYMSLLCLGLLALIVA